MGNTTNAQCTDHSLPGSPLVAIGSLTFYSALGVIGLFGNVHVILVFASSREKSLRFLITVLSVMDLLISVVVLPTDCYRVYNDYLARSQGIQATNHWFSTLILSSRYAAFEMEAWILVFIAVDRYLCIVRASQSGLSYRKTLGALAGAGLSLLLLESCNVISHFLVEDRCSLKLQLESYLLYFYGCLGTLSVLLVMALYVRIFTFVAFMERRRSSRRKVTERTLALLSRADASTAPAAGAAAAAAGDAAAADCNGAGTSAAGLESTVTTRLQVSEVAPSSPVASATLRPPATQQRPIAAVAVDGPTGVAGAIDDCSSGCNFPLDGGGSRRPCRPRHHRRPMASGGGGGGGAGSGSGSDSWFPRRLAWMLFGATVLFYASMVPMILINFKLLPDSPLHRIFYLNTSLNFFVYAMMNSKFRSELTRLYAGCCPRNAAAH